VDELFLVDDGSTDGSRAVAEQMGVRVISMGRNAGRGAVRATAMEHAQHDFVLSCDATNFLPHTFIEQAMKWFDDPFNAAVFGRMWQESSIVLSDRWRGRHLFKMSEERRIHHGALLSTYGCLVRRRSVLEVGNYDHSLQHSEDADLGSRLLKAGFDVIFDPSLKAISSTSNPLSKVLERYWRWNVGKDEVVNVPMYAREIWYAFKVMARRDLQDRDLLSVPVTLFSPHYKFWRSCINKYAAKP
jgi:glycosyltransferase involved in cell wall biosynthesis